MSTNVPQKSQFLVYEAENGQVKIDVRLENETVWLTQPLMAQLFQTTQQNISLHVRNIIEEGELAKKATHKEYLSVRREGNRDVQRQLDYYNLDMIISVGYRVKSAVATRFRIWATQRLREYIVKGFTLDDERLKNPDQPFDYFDELTRRIQDIRTSERRFYQKITDIYATSIDYDPTFPISIEFFKAVQNKMHWAITGQTAAEIIHGRADASRPNMGLTNWRGAKVRKDDVFIAKNYLDETELAALNNLVEQYLVFAEGQAMRRIPMHMTDWIKKIEDGFVRFRQDHETADLRQEGRQEMTAVQDSDRISSQRFGGQERRLGSVGQSRGQGQSRGATGLSGGRSRYSVASGDPGLD